MARERHVGERITGALAMLGVAQEDAARALDRDPATVCRNLGQPMDEAAWFTFRLGLAAAEVRFRKRSRQTQPAARGAA